MVYGICEASTNGRKGQVDKDDLLLVLVLHTYFELPVIFTIRIMIAIAITIEVTKVNSNRDILSIKSKFGCNTIVRYIIHAVGFLQ